MFFKGKEELHSKIGAKIKATGDLFDEIEKCYYKMNLKLQTATTVQLVVNITYKNKKIRAIYKLAIYFDFMIYSYDFKP